MCCRAQLLEREKSAERLSTGQLGSTGLKKEGSGTWTLSGANSYSGATTVSAGTLNVANTGNISSSSATTINGGNLVVNGTAGAVTVNSGGSLLGSGTVGAVALTSGSFLKPGNSPWKSDGHFASVWNSGATYEWQISSLTGTAGTAWDLFTVTSGLNLSALSSSSTFNLSLDSAGALAGFSRYLGLHLDLCKSGKYNRFVFDKMLGPTSALSSISWRRTSMGVRGLRMDSRWWWGKLPEVTQV